MKCRPVRSTRNTCDPAASGRQVSGEHSGSVESSRNAVAVSCLARARVVTVVKRVVPNDEMQEYGL